MKKLLGGASALALLLGLSAQGIAAELDINGDEADADAISANIMIQDVENDVDVEDTLLEEDALYNARMLFGNDTFRLQDADVNNFNTGINGSQQGGLAIAVSNDGGSDDGAVSVNYLSQTAVNSIEVDDDDGVDDATYAAVMDFGGDTFRDQDVVVNNFNTGWNGAQQGGIAITGATGTLTTP